jgi:hydroxymethylpyrimidine/phosphomethylpyrimidine kinase
MTRPKLLSIAGSDPSGGAGIQADLKTFAAFGCYGMAAITALTVQNTTGVARIAPVEAELLAAQIDALFADIKVDAVKIGMLATAVNAEAVAASLARAGAKTIVLDPVLAATAGPRVGEEALPRAIVRHLLPLAMLVTPNLAEAAALTATPLARTPEDMAAQARLLVDAGAQVALVKGGHLDGAPIDVLVTGGGEIRLVGRRIATKNTHGTGCALSAAIAAELARGAPLEAAVASAKQWLEGALAAGADVALGAGAGPPDHLWTWRSVGRE